MLQFRIYYHFGSCDYTYNPKTAEWTERKGLMMDSGARLWVHYIEKTVPRTLVAWGIKHGLYHKRLN